MYSIYIRVSRSAVGASSVESKGSMKRHVKARAAGSTAELEGVGGSIVDDVNHRQGRERHHQRSRCIQLHQAYREKEELVAWTRT